jgi:tetratricopeptide (TPR) repeat protein
VKLDPATLKKIDRIGDEFMANALRHEVERRDNIPAMFELGTVLTRLQRFEEGLEIDRRLVRIQPEQPVLRYNLACSLALLDCADEAIEELAKAIDLGYDDAEHMLQDSDLASLRRDSRFQELVDRIRAREESESELHEESEGQF